MENILAEDRGTKPPPKPAQEGFSIDHEKTGQLEVPSITQLLNRKKLGLETPELPPKMASTPQIRGAAPLQDRRTKNRLELWDESDPIPPPDPTTLEGLVRSLKKLTHASWVLILAPTAAGAFEAKAVLGGGRELWTLTTGFRWQTQPATPGYTALMTQGWNELTPHSTLGDARALRAALAMEASQSLWMIAGGKRGAPPSRVILAAVPLTAPAAGSSPRSWIEKNQDALLKI